MKKEEIDRLVFERYPVKEKEKTCMDLRDRRNGLRQAYRKRLMNEYATANTEQVKTD